MLSSLILTLISSTTVFAQLSSMRATIPGSLHQCEQTTLFLFDTSNTRPITLVLLPTSSTPTSTSLTLREAKSIGPLQILEGITTPDAASHAWQISIAENVEFTTWGFFPDGTGKNLGLNRKVMTALPGQGESCKAATVEDANRNGSKNSGGRKANTGSIIVGVAAPESLASTTTEKGKGSSVLMIMAPTTAVQAVSTPITSALATNVQDSSTTSTTDSSEEEQPSQSVVVKADTSESTNSASGQIVMKWLVGGLGIMTIGIVGW